MSPKRERTEDGMTMVELLVTVVITGLIIAVVCATLIMAIQMGPQVKARSTEAAQGAFLVNALSDDVANATAVSTNPFGQSADTTACTTPGANANGPFGYAGLDTFTLFDGSTVAYSVTIAAASPPIPNYLAVEVDRTAGVSKSVMVQGYCHTGDTGIVSVGYTNPTYSLNLKILGAAGGEAREVSFVANRRGYTNS